MDSSANRDTAGAALQSADDLGAEVRAAVGRLYRRFRAERPDGDLGDVALTVLAGLRARGPQTLTALSDHEGVTRATMSQIVNRLTAPGYAIRIPDPDDRRQVLFTITEDGRAVDAAARARRNAWFDSKLNELTKQERETLARAAVILKGIAQS